MLQTFSFLITGKVQGVFYRQSTKEKALELGLKGIVRNLSDGSVEIVATGTKEQIDQLARWCQQGPPKARVTSVEIHELPLKSYTSFTIDR